MVIVIGDKLDTAYLVLSTYLLTYFITNINIHIFWVIIVRREMYPQYTDTPPDLDHLELFPPPSDCMIYISHHKKTNWYQYFNS